MKVLVIRRGALGDIIHVASCFEKVKSQRPDVELHVLTDKSCFPLLESMATVSKIHEWPRNNDPIGYVATLTAARTVKAENFDLIINLMPAIKSKLIAWYCKVPRLTLKKQRSNVRGAALRNETRPHVAQEYYETFQRALNLRPAQLSDLIPKMQWPIESAASGSSLTRIGLVMGAAARRQNKSWPTKHFSLLAEKLLGEFDCEIVLIGGKNESELGDGMPKSGRIRNRIGIPLSETISELQSCSLVVGADTGPTHIATALNVPVVMLFGPTSAKRTGPLNRSAVVSPPGEMACWPCERRKCPLHGAEFQQCMREISVEQVFLACKSMLNKSLK